MRPVELETTDLDPLAAAALERALLPGSRDGELVESIEADEIHAARERR